MNDLATHLSGYMRELAHGFSVKGPLAALGSFLAGLVGGWDQIINMLVLLMIFDFALGFWRAWRVGDVRLSKIKKGLLKFILYGIAVMVFTALDVACGQAVGELLRISLRDLMIAYLCVTESLSCIEHLTAFGVPFPVWLVERLRNYRDGCGKEA